MIEFFVGKGAKVVRQFIDSDGHLWEDAEVISKVMPSPYRESRREIREIEEHKELTEEDQRSHSLQEREEVLQDLIR